MPSSICKSSFRELIVSYVFNWTSSTNIIVKTNYPNVPPKISIQLSHKLDSNKEIYLVWILLKVDNKILDNKFDNAPPAIFVTSPTAPIKIALQLKEAGANCHVHLLFHAAGPTANTPLLPHKLTTTDHGISARKPIQTMPPSTPSPALQPPSQRSFHLLQPPHMTTCHPRIAAPHCPWLCSFVERISSADDGTVCLIGNLGLRFFRSNAMWSIMIFCSNKIDLFGRRVGALGQYRNTTNLLTMDAIDNSKLK